MPRRDDFRVTEEGRDVEIVDFRAPIATEAIPTTVVLVVDRSLSMEEENRIGGLKRAVDSFLEKLPAGSRVALIAFGSEVDRLASFTTDRGQIKTAVDALEPAGATRFYDAVAAALEMLDHETGRRAVLALTDGEDTFSQSANLDSVIASREADRFARLHPRPGNRGRDRKRRPPAAGELDARAVLSGTERRPAPRDLRTDRRAAQCELLAGVPERPQDPRRHAAARSDHLSGQHQVRRRRRPFSFPAWSSPRGAGRRFFSACWRGLHSSYSSLVCSGARSAPVAGLCEAELSTPGVTDPDYNLACVVCK